MDEYPGGSASLWGKAWTISLTWERMERLLGLPWGS